MAKLKEYSTLEEKEDLFINGSSRIQVNLKEAFQILDNFVERGKGNFAFRGMNEAKFKLYNSAQRYYLNQELNLQVDPEVGIESHYNNFISSMIDECRDWNSGTGKKLLSTYNINEENALAYLSYMQHYGVPTPFLDFTFDPYTALFFALDNLSFYPSDNEIDNYFSIYYTDTSSVVYSSWRSIFAGGMKEYKEFGKISYEELNDYPMHLLLPTDQEYKIINNTNILNQRGLFFLQQPLF